VPRRKSLRGKKGESERKLKGYLKRDNKILLVASYLVGKGDDGATIGNIISVKANIVSTSQDQTLFTKTIMEPMERDGWVKKRKYGARMQVYVITEKGKSAVSDAHKLRQDGSLLSTLEAFRGFVK